LLFATTCQVLKFQSVRGSRSSKALRFERKSKNHDADPPERSANPINSTGEGNSKSEGFSRRTFLTQLSAAGIAAAAAPLVHSPHAVTLPATVVEPVPQTQVPSALPFVLNINGQDRRVLLEPRVTLLARCLKICSFLARRKAAIMANAERAPSR
jgi:hypothetical protein